MGKLKELVNNYVYHPKTSRAMVYGLGALDFLAIDRAVDYLKGDSDLISTLAGFSIAAVIHFSATRDAARQELYYSS